MTHAKAEQQQNIPSGVAQVIAAAATRQETCRNWVVKRATTEQYHHRLIFLIMVSNPTPT